MVQLPLPTSLAESAVPAAIQPAAAAQLAAESFEAGSHVVFSAVAGAAATAAQASLQTLAKRDLSAGLCFLVDHAWSFVSVETAVGQLEGSPALLQRVKALVGHPTDNAGLGPRAALELIGPRLRSYAVPADASGSRLMPVFYMRDEVGSRMLGTAADSPAANCGCATVEHVTAGGGGPVCYDVVWTTRPVAEGEPLVVPDLPAAANTAELLAAAGLAPPPAAAAAPEPERGAATEVAGQPDDSKDGGEQAQRQEDAGEEDEEGGNEELPAGTGPLAVRIGVCSR